MTFEDFEIIKNTNIEQYIDCCPMQLALKGVDKAICTQVKYLQKSKAKLPLFYEARCVIPELSFEQSSSLYTSKAKNYAGKTCVDLTCGLGSDSLHFSGSFSRVISLEYNELLSKIAKFNFEKLKAENIEVVNADSHEFIKNYEGEMLDLIFIDPARRSEQKRVFLFEDCSPNVFEILKFAPKIAKRMVIKASPLYDVEQAKRDFESFGKVIIESVSYNNECKELVVDIEFAQEKTVEFHNVIISKHGEIARVKIEENAQKPKLASMSADYKYLYVADVAFYKSRTLEGYLSTYFPMLELTSVNGVALGYEFYDDFLGRKYEIVHQMPYKPKLIKQYLKQNGIKNATIIKRGGKYSINEIYKQLNLTSGAQITLIEVNDTLLFLR